jgi:hypothetical protein
MESAWIAIAAVMVQLGTLWFIRANQKRRNEQRTNHSRTRKG